MKIELLLKNNSSLQLPKQDIIDHYKSLKNFSKSAHQVIAQKHT